MSGRFPSRWAFLPLLAAGLATSLSAQDKDNGGGPDDSVAIKGPPGSQVKLDPAPPALPGEPPNNLGDFFAYARMLYWAGQIDKLNQLIGADVDTPGMPPLSLIVLDAFFRQLELERPYKILEDGADHPDGTCGAGNGEGPTIKIGDPPDGMPPDDPALDAWEKLAKAAQDRAKQFEGEPDYSDEDWDFNFEEPDLNGDYHDWIGEEFDKAAAGGKEQAQANAPSPEEAAKAAAEAKKAAVKAEHDRLQKKYDILKERQDRLNRASKNLQEAIDNTDDPKEKKRLQGQLGEITTIQDKIHDESTPIAEQLRDLEKPQIAAKDEHRAQIANEINTKAAPEIARRLGIKGTLQDVKDVYTAGAQWISIGAHEQRSTSRTTRMADFELTAAEVKLDVINTMMQNAEPGSETMELLQESKDANERQKAAADALLSSNATITAIGYGTDVVLLITGAKLAQLGKVVVVEAAGKVFVAETAERVVATTTETGLTDLVKGAVARGGTTEVATEAATHATAAGTGKTAGSASTAASEGTSKLATEAHEAAQAAGGGSSSGTVGSASGQVGGGSSEIATAALDQAAIDKALSEAANAGAGDIVRVGANGKVHIFRGDISTVLRQMAEDSGNEALNNAAELVEHVADQLGVSQHEALDRIVSGTVGHGTLPVDATPEVMEVFEALEEAGARGREVFNSPEGQRLAENARRLQAEQAAAQDAAKRAAANERAQQILGGRYGAQEGANKLNSAREAVKDWFDSVEFGSGTFYSMVPLLIGLWAEESDAAQAQQTTLDAQGNGSIPTNGDAALQYFTPRFSGFQFGVHYNTPNSDNGPLIKLNGGGPAYGSYGDGNPPSGLGQGNQLNFGNSRFYDRLDYSLPLNASLHQDSCRIKKAEPADEEGPK